MSSQNSRLIVALDNLKESQVSTVISQIGGEGVIFKANDWLMKQGLRGMRRFIDTQKTATRWMLDPKTFDIPQTWANYIDQLVADLDDLHNSGMGEITDIYTLHASGNKAMIEAMVRRRDALRLQTRLAAITVLTSWNDADCRRIYRWPVKDTVLSLSVIAKQGGADGIVTSGDQNTTMVREYFGPDFLIVTPWIRFSGKPQEDQKRVVNPEEAARNGASHIVMGRDIINAQIPTDAVQEAVRQIRSAPLFVSSGKDYRLERAIYEGTVEDILKASGNVYRRSEGGPYVRLSSKALSDGYVNVGGAVESDSRMLERFTRDLADEIDRRKISADLVIGAATGSIRLSDNLGRMLGTNAIYTEKDGKNEDGTDRHILKRHARDLRGARVVVSEDVITKWHTSRQIIDIVRAGGGEVVAITCVVNRSGKDAIDGIPLIELWTPPKFNMFYDDQTPEQHRTAAEILPEGAEVFERPKEQWRDLVKTMN